MNSSAGLAAAALARAAEMLGALSPAQLEDLATGRGRLVFQPTRAPRGTGADPSDRRPGPGPVGAEVAVAVETIRGLSSAREVADHLQRQQYTVPVLKEIAAALGPTVAAARSKADLQRNIVEGTVGFRTRSAAMSGGAWS